MGNTKFEKLRKILILPHKRTLQVMKNNIPHGSGYQKELFEKLRHLWSTFAKSRKDWDCIVSWDATGYKKTLKFDKFSGMLIGFGADKESFSMHQMFSEKVLCYMTHTIILFTISQSSGELFHGLFARKGYHCQLPDRLFPLLEVGLCCGKKTVVVSHVGTGVVRTQRGVVGM